MYLNKDCYNFSFIKDYGDWIYLLKTLLYQRCEDNTGLFYESEKG